VQHDKKEAIEKIPRFLGISTLRRKGAQVEEKGKRGQGEGGTRGGEGSLTSRRLPHQPFSFAWARGRGGDIRKKKEGEIKPCR